MRKATVQIIAPIFVDGEWIFEGEPTLDHDIAADLDCKGMVHILAVDGLPVIAAGRCSQE